MKSCNLFSGQGPIKEKNVVNLPFECITNTEIISRKRIKNSVYLSSSRRGCRFRLAIYVERYCTEGGVGCVNNRHMVPLVINNIRTTVDVSTIYIDPKLVEVGGIVHSKCIPLGGSSPITPMDKFCSLSGSAIICKLRKPLEPERYCVSNFSDRPLVLRDHRRVPCTIKVQSKT